MDVLELLEQIEKFKAGSLTRQVAAIENQLMGIPPSQIAKMVGQFHVDNQLLEAALTIKHLSAQIDVVVHAVGILYALPFILAEDEVVTSVSLGASNAGSGFDLVTNQQIAEFKFIHWQPKGNAIREKTLFQDFYKLAHTDTDKKKNLYLLQTDRPLRFLTGNRNILKVLDRRRLTDDFRRRFGDRFTTVGEFYSAFKHEVFIQNLSQRVPNLEKLVM